MSLSGWRKIPPVTSAQVVGYLTLHRTTVFRRPPKSSNLLIDVAPDELQRLVLRPSLPCDLDLEIVELRPCGLGHRRGNNEGVDSRFDPSWWYVKYQTGVPRGRHNWQQPCRPNRFPSLRCLKAYIVRTRNAVLQSNIHYDSFGCRGNADARNCRTGAAGTVGH